MRVVGAEVVETDSSTITWGAGVAAIAGTGVGWIADHWGWTGVFATMVVCCVLTIVFSAMTLGHRATSTPERATALR